jgi:hypothetical protein
LIDFRALQPSFNLEFFSDDKQNSEIPRWVINLLKLSTKFSNLKFHALDFRSRNFIAAKIFYCHFSNFIYSTKAMEHIFGHFWPIFLPFD